MQTVIIGGGVAGLTAGIYGQLAGLNCIIIEKNKFTGGNLTGWERKGYSIDNCMHWLNGTKRGSKLNDLWRTVGMLSDNITLCRHRAFYSVELNGKSLSLWRDIQRTKKEMCSISPYDRKESLKFIKVVEKLRIAKEKGINVKISILSSFPELIRYSRMTLGELSKKFKHPLLRCLMTDYFSPELSAISLVLAYSEFISGNADVPAGGSKEAAERMEKRYLALGGKLLTSSEVKNIIFEGKRAVGVKLSDGRTVVADRVIACCDPSFTFGQLVPSVYMPRSLVKAYKDTEHMPVFSALHAAFSCDITEDLPDDPVIFDIKNIIISGRTAGRMLVKPYTSKEIKIPEGKAVLQVMFYLYEPEALKWIEVYGNKEKYRELKHKFASEISSRIIERYPSVEKSLKTLDVWTPASYKRYFNAKSGSFLSFAIKPGRAMMLRVPSKVKGFENFYIATQWQRSPGGLPVAALSAKRTIKKITVENYAEKRIHKLSLTQENQNASFV